LQAFGIGSSVNAMPMLKCSVSGMSNGEETRVQEEHDEKDIVMQLNKSKTQQVSYTPYIVLD